MVKHGINVGQCNVIRHTKRSVSSLCVSSSVVLQGDGGEGSAGRALSGRHGLLLWKTLLHILLPDKDQTMDVL